MTGVRNLLVLEQLRLFPSVSILNVSLMSSTRALGVAHYLQELLLARWICRSWLEANSALSFGLVLV